MCSPILSVQVLHTRAWVRKCRRRRDSMDGRGTRPWMVEGRGRSCASGNCSCIALPSASMPSPALATLAHPCASQRRSSCRRGHGCPRQCAPRAAGWCRLFRCLLPAHQSLDPLDQCRRRDIERLCEDQQRREGGLPDAALKHAYKRAIYAAGKGECFLTDRCCHPRLTQGVTEGFGGSSLEGIHATIVLVVRQ